MTDFEKLGVFYLGKTYDLKQKKVDQDYVLLKSKDLTTHAVIIGMTGSGKTGLGIGLIEEAMMDNIPVIAIDPKGDLSNLALTFPEFRGEDFEPWINLQEASNQGKTPAEFAKDQAEIWKSGLAEWGQDGKRIETLKREAEVKIFTPGGTGGVGVSVLKSFSAPKAEILQDKEALGDRLSATTHSILSLIGITADPFTSREFILISNILESNWVLGKSLGLADLISAVQKPPFDKIGVMDLESFYPSKDRFGLAMMLNNLLASPGFEAWLEGEPLDIGGFLYRPDGKPRTSVFSIAHLNDSERMFFVTMLLNEVVGWMRTQTGTGSLRAILYMDEVFGYLPPTANPPSKGPLLTLLKQARAYGLGLVLSTQNPVDLDYKALSNAGTWFIGRLQTERDKERVLAGLEGAASGGHFNKSETEQILAGLGKRVFYRHSVHEDVPLIFSTRWVMSYLAGPLSRDQLSSLSGFNEESPAHLEKEADVVKASKEIPDSGEGLPVLPPNIKQIFLPYSGNLGSGIRYRPAVIGVTDVLYTSSKYGISEMKNYIMVTPFKEGPVALNWDDAQHLALGMDELEQVPVEGATFMTYPAVAAEAKQYTNWKRLLSQFIRTSVHLTLFSCPKLKLISEYGEDERAFRIRVQHQAHEERDAELEALKQKYDSKFRTLEGKLQRAEQAVEKQSHLASQRKLDAAVSAGSAILGALLGRKAVSATSVSKMGTAMRRTSQALKSGQGIDQAEERFLLVQQEIEALNATLEDKITEISSKYDAIKDDIESIDVRALSGNITVHLVGLAWIPESD